MKKIIWIGLVGIGCINMWSVKEKAKNVKNSENTPDEIIFTEPVLPKAQAVIQTLQNPQSAISSQELDQRITELDQMIANSNMLAKLNGNDLNDDTRTEFYRVIEARQFLLTEQVRQEIARSQLLLGGSWQSVSEK